MKNIKRYLSLLVVILLAVFFISCNETESEFKIIIGEDGNWYVNDVNTGFSSIGKDGTDGKSAYEIAVEKGYEGTLEQWLEQFTKKDGTLNVFDKDSNEIQECEVEIVSGKLLLSITKTETITIEKGTVNEVAYEDLTFKDIFEDNNYAPVNMNSKESKLASYSDYSGTTTIQNKDYNTAPSAMYVEGSKSQQAKSNVALTGTFYIASKVKCTRYVKGYLGIVFGTDSEKYKDTTLQEMYDDEYLLCSSIQTLNSDYIFIGSAISADLDGYIDDPVVVDLSIFESAPNNVYMDALYEKYLRIVNGDITPNIKTEVVTTKKVYYLGQEESKFTDAEAKIAFMKYMNEKAKNIGMTKTTFVDAAGFYNKTTAHDLLRLGVYACSYDALVDAWHKDSYVVTVNGNNPRNVPLTTTVAGSQLENYYFLFGGKTGTVDGQQNLLAIVEGEDNKLFCVVVLGCEENRFKVAKDAMDIAMKVYRKEDVAGLDVACKSAAVCVVPPYNTKAYTDYPLDILYAKDINTQRTPASVTKVMTSICMLDYVSDINESFMIIDSDITSGSGNYFYGGDIITFREALHAMMLPSSNTCAEATATAAGHKILEYASK